MTDVLAVILAWAITFTVVCTLVLCLGFGSIGVGAGMSFRSKQTTRQLPDSYKEHLLLFFNRTCTGVLLQQEAFLRRSQAWPCLEP